MIGIKRAQIRCGLARLSEDKSRQWKVPANRCAVNARCHLFSRGTTMKHLLRGRTMPRLRIGQDGELASNGPAMCGGSLRAAQARLRCARWNDKASSLMILPLV